MLETIAKYQCPIRLKKFLIKNSITQSSSKKYQFELDLSERAKEVAEIFYENRKVFSNKEFIEKTKHIMDEFGNYR